MARNDFESNYLMHHGILGQKWGKKNGPPYPLSDKEHDKVVKKAKQDAKKGNKWATSEHQPSSIRASIAAGRYAAHPTKRNEEKLRKLNDRDEARYKAAKNEYKNIRDKDTKEFNSAKLREGKNIINKRAGDGYAFEAGRQNRKIIDKYLKKIWRRAIR